MSSFDQGNPYLFALFSPISSARVANGASQDTDQVYQLAFYNDGSIHLTHRFYVGNDLIREMDADPSLIKTLEWGWAYRPTPEGVIYHDFYDKNGKGICLNINEQELITQHKYFLTKL